MADKVASGMVEPVRFGNGIDAFRAFPEAKGRQPAVIILHERYGIDQHTKDLTARLAAAGFVGFAPDLFHRFTGDRKAVLRGDQRVELTDAGALEDLNAAVAYLKTLDGVDGARIAVIGVCQSGRQALLLPANREGIAGAVVLYGAIGGKEWLPNDLRPTAVEDLMARVNCPVLGIFGEADHIISIDDVVRFRNSLEKARKNYYVRLYRGAPHGWLNDTMPGRYRKEAAEDAWKLMMNFLNKCFAAGWDPERISGTYESDYARSYDFSKNVRME